MRIGRVALNCLVLIGLLVGMFSPILSLSLTDNLAGAQDMMDTDVDGIVDAEDNCSEVINADQADADGNGVGDACEPAELDADLDGLVDNVDNCSDVSNPGQEDFDSDGLGDACDPPATSELEIWTWDTVSYQSVPGACYQLVDIYSDQHEQCDSDDGANDGYVHFTGLPAGTVSLIIIAAPSGYDVPYGETIYVGLVADSMVGYQQPLFPIPEVPDTDRDDVTDDLDNCWDVANTDQMDSDWDSIGDACDESPNPPPTQAAEPADVVTQTGSASILSSDPDGVPVAGACFQLTSTDWREYAACDIDDGSDDGATTIAELPAGQYTVYIQTMPGRPNEYYSGLTEQMVVDVIGGDNVIKTFPVTPIPGILEFVPLVDGEGVAVWGGTYGVWAGDACPLGTVEPAFTFTPTGDEFPRIELLPGTYCVAGVVAPPGYETQQPAPHVVYVESPAVQGVTSLIFLYEPVAAPTEEVHPTYAPTWEPDATAVSQDINTTVGSDVAVTGLADGQVSVTFAEVTQEGTTTATYLGTPMGLPDGYNAWNAMAYEIDTTALHVGSISVCVSYSAPSYADPSTIVLFHDDGSGWADITMSNDGNGMICGMTESLSPFAIVEKVPTGSLQIMAEDWWGQPAPNIALTVHYVESSVCSEGTLVASVTTDGNGVALIPDIPFSSYCITDGLDTTTGHASVWDSTIPSSATVVVGVRPELGTIILQLQDENGSPLTADQIGSNACARARSDEAEGVRACDNSDGVIDGRITFDGYPRTVWTLEGYQPPYGYTTDQFPSEVSGFQSGQTDVRGVLHTAYAAPSTSLVVTVVDQDGSILPGACFGATAVADGVSYGAGCDRNDGLTDGRIFLVGPFRAGDYVLSSIDNGVGWGLPGTYSQNVTIPESSTDLAYATVTMTPSLVVSAADENGSPVPVCVFISSDTFYSNPCTGVDGRVEIYGLSDGDYTVQGGGATGFTSEFSATTVSVVSGQISRVDIPLISQDVSLTVSVVDGDGNPILGACPTVVDANGQWTYAECTDASGQTVFYGLSGTVTVSLDSPPRGYEPADSVLVNLSTTTSVILESTAKPTSFTVQTMDGSGSVLRGACVTLSTAEGQYLDQSCDGYQDSPDGLVGFFGFEPGSYQVSAYISTSDAWWNADPMPVTVAPGDVVKLTLQSQHSGTATSLAVVNTVDGAGTALPGACYTVLFPGRSAWHACDDTDGANDGVTIFASPYGEHYFSGEYLLIQSVAPEGNELALLQTFSVGAERPVNVTVTHGPTPDTSVGENVVVVSEGDTGVSLSFSNVTTAGTTTVEPVTDGSVPEMTGSFSADGVLFFDIHTTATFDGPVEICIPYDPTAFETPDVVRLLHYENGAWIDVTTSNDPAGIVCGSVTSFSPFAIVMPAATVEGFHSPVKMGAAPNTVRAGSTVPLKFDVYRGTFEVADPDAVTDFSVVQISCDAGTNQAPIEVTVSGGPSLAYVDGHFQQNWKTPREPGCYQVTITTADDQTITAEFRLK